MPTRPTPPVTGDRAATRAKLLAAARRQFSVAGYGQVGVRQIAAEADVNAALINRYFGSKLKLFAEVVGDSFTIGNLLLGERATLGDRLARYLVRPRPQGFDPTMVLLHSAPHPDAGGVLRAALAEQVASPLATWLGGPDARERAGLVVAVLFGFTLTRDVIGASVLGAHEEVLVGHLGDVLQRLINGA